jgi:hypothetical protein
MGDLGWPAACLLMVVVVSVCAVLLAMVNSGKSDSG